MPRRARRNREQSPQTLDESTARLLSPDRAPLLEVRAGRRTWVEAVRAERLRVRLRAGPGEAAEPPLQREQGGGVGQLPSEQDEGAPQLGELHVGHLVRREQAETRDAQPEHR